MSRVKQIESALEQMPVEDLQTVRDWLDDFIEAQLEVTEEFKAKIQRANQEIADGIYSRVAQGRSRQVSAGIQAFSRDFDADFLKLSPDIRIRIESSIDRLGMTLESYPHHRMKGVGAYRIRVGDYRVIYDFDRSKGVLYLLSVGHRREVYRR